MDLQVVEKQALAAKTVLMKINMKGLTAADSKDCYKSQLHYLSFEPLAPSPFPAYLRKLMHSQDVEDSWPAEIFWSMIADKVLAPILGDESIEEFQLNTMAAKTMLLVQAETSEEAHGRLTQFCLAFPASGAAEGVAISSCKVGPPVILPGASADLFFVDSAFSFRGSMFGWCQ